MHRDAYMSRVKSNTLLTLIYFRNDASFELSALNIVIRFCLKKHRALAFLSPEFKINVFMADAAYTPNVTGKRRLPPPPSEEAGEQHEGANPGVTPCFIQFHG